MGTFARLASGFSTDPAPGGQTNVLTYVLPMTFFGASPFDIAITDPNNFADNDADFVRFEGNQLFVYSTQTFGIGDCTIMPAPGSGCDGLADRPTLPVVVGSATAQEINGFAFFPGGPVEFDLGSDLGASPCPASSPRCQITGLAATPGIVAVPTPDAGNPFATPEPGGIWLLSLGALVLCTGEYFRRKKISKA